MIASHDGKAVPIVMKRSHFLRYYYNMRGILLSPESAEDEAANLGIVIDHAGEIAAKANLSPKSDDLHRRAA